MTPTEIDREIYVAKWQTEGQDPNAADWYYWRGKAPELIARGIEINFGGGSDPGRAYMREKLIGWQATGADLPRYGPYAQPPTVFHSVPDVAPPPAPEPKPDPVPAFDIQDVLVAIATIQELMGTLATKDDIRSVRNELIAAAKDIGKQLTASGALGALGGIFGRREAPSKNAIMNGADSPTPEELRVGFERENSERAAAAGHPNKVKK